MKKTICMMIALIMLLSVASVSFAEAKTDWPKDDIKVICGYAPGGSNDIAARATVEAINPNMPNGKVMYVENIAGASGSIGCTELCNADPDGYTLMIGGSGIITTTPMTMETQYDHNSITPIAGLVSMPSCMVASKDAPFNDFDSWVAWCKDHPGEFTYAVAGLTSPATLAADALCRMIGIECTPVVYSGTAEGTAQMLGGHVMGATSKDSDYASYVESGDCNVIFLTNPYGVWGDCDAVASNHGYDFFFTNSIYIYGPAGMDKDVVWDIYSIVEKTFETDLLKQNYKNADMIPALLNPDEARAEIDYLAEQGRELLVAAGVTLYR